MSDLLQQVEQSYLACKFKKNIHFLVGVSGGVDSIVLAHSLLQLKKNYPIQISVIYIDHQLNPRAKRWGQTVQKFANNNDVEFLCEKISIENDLKLGIEGAARKKRYEAFAKNKKDFLVLAHHEDDQFETLLLQLSRGAGLKGLSCMAELDESRKIWRPLLDVPKTTITAYQQMHQLTYIEDDSNLNNQFDRNYIRNRVIPVIKKRFPLMAKNANRSVKHIADHYLQQKDVIKQSYSQAITKESSLRGDFIKELDDLNLTQLIRFWLDEHQILMPSTRVMSQIIKQVRTLDAESNIKIKIQHHTIQSYNQQLFIVSDDVLNFPQLIWKDDDVIKLQQGHFIFFEKKMGEGLSKKLLEGGQVLISKPKSMSQKLRIHDKQPSRDLKYLFQKHKVPTWERLSYPCIYIDNSLAAVIGIGINPEVQAKRNEMGYVITYKKPQQ